MLGPAPENPRKNTVVKKQKNIHSAYPQSDGVRSESARKSSGSVKTSPKNAPSSPALRMDDAPAPNTVSTNTLVALPSNVNTLAPGKYRILHIIIYRSFFYCFVDLNAHCGDTGR